MRLVLCCLAVLILISVSAGAAVTVVSTYPANGEVVDPSITHLRVRFSEPVSPADYSFCNTDQGTPVPMVGKPVFEDGNKLCIQSVTLQPGTSYAISVNSEKIKYFHSAASGTPVTPYLLKFTTSGKALDPPVTNAAGMTPDKWQQDLAYLAGELPSKHKNLFARITEADWKDSVQKLSDQLPKLTEAETLVALNNLIAHISDPHTTINILGSKQLSVLPMLAYRFKDGVFIVAASDSSKLGCQIIKVGGVDVDKACDALSSTFAHDNQSACKYIAPMFVTAPDFLKSVGVIARLDAVELTLVSKDGKRMAEQIRSIKNGSVHDLRSIPGPSAPTPLYRKYPALPYWAEYIKSGNIVYFQYNKCHDDPEHPFKTVETEVEKLLTDHKDARLVVDLRNNGGGSSMVLDPLIAWVRSDKDLKGKGKVFVITGRRTFSSAILNTLSLRRQCHAILVGEPTGASPNGYGEVDEFKLPNSGLPVRYSTKYFREVKEDVDAVYPDVPAEPTFDEY